MSDPPSRPLELELLLACARVDLDGCHREAIRYLIHDPELSWPRFRRLVERHRIEALVYTQLKSATGLHADRGEKQDQWPVEFEALPSVRGVLEETVLGNLTLLGELVSLAKCLEAREIAFIPYKGPLLTQQAYGNLRFRRSRDLDLIVDQKDLDAVSDAMQTAGYELPDPPSRLGRFLHHFLKKEYAWEHQEKGIFVEIHSRPFPPGVRFGMATETLFSCAVPFEWSGRTWKSLPPEETVLLLSVHGSLHEWRRMHWLSALAEYCRVQGDRLDWDRVAILADEAGCRRSLELSRLLLSRYWPEVISISGDDTSRLECIPRVEKLAERVEVLWGAEGEGMLPLFEEIGFHMALLASRRDRMRYMFRLLALAVLRPIMVEGVSWAELLSRPLQLARRHRITWTN